VEPVEHGWLSIATRDLAGVKIAACCLLRAESFYTREHSARVGLSLTHRREPRLTWTTNQLSNQDVPGPSGRSQEHSNFQQSWRIEYQVSRITYHFVLWALGTGK